jgi:hypothetical protein
MAHNHSGHASAFSPRAKSCRLSRARVQPAGETFEVSQTSKVLRLLRRSTRVAMRVQTSPENSVYYLHTDHPSTSLRTSLGSMSLTTDASGNPTSQLRYLPYDAPRSGYPTGNVPTDLRFTGQRSNAYINFKSFPIH